MRASLFPALLAGAWLSLGACARPTAVGNVAEPPAIRYMIDSAAGVPRELTADEQVQQALARLTFGARPGEAARVRAMGVDRWIDLQLHPERIDDHAADTLLAHYPTLGESPAELTAMYRQAQQARREAQKNVVADGDTTAGARAARQQYLRDHPELRELTMRAQRLTADVQAAKLARAVESERQLDEVMVDFWENHFSVFQGKGQTRIYLASYDRDVIRPNAMGKFRDLLGAVAKSPAMLFYLDNWQSAADSLHPTLASGEANAAAGSRVRPFGRGRTVVLARIPRPRAQAQQQRRRPQGLNENYARELMELHTLGVDGGYTQHDVIEVARALTGWSFDPRTGAFVFRPALHDAGEKMVLGHTLPAGRGIEDGEEVLDILARQPATAHFIATKLVHHFVSDSAPPALVDRAARVFLATDGDIRETLRTIVTSPEFFSRAAYRVKVKTPFEVVASTLRALDAIPDTTARTAQIVARLGQPIFGRQTPDGWPDRGDAWMNTGAILNRINFGLAVAAGRVPGVSIARVPALASLATADRAAQVDGVVRELLGGAASPETRAVLMKGANPLLDKLAPNDSTPMRTTMVAQQARAGLEQIVGLALGAPEFQRR